ncbi:hypothetical protein SNE40_015238 [Patella caerulea]|uniref:YDG domain-containing protein n=1 Tax=Patella caerulea TaxID=87958 RepID=A0AAN8PRS8_PATCE
MATSTYEELRRKNIEDNKRILAQLGLVNPFRPIQKVVKKGVRKATPLQNVLPRPKTKKRPITDIEEDLENCGSLREGRRKSARIQGKPSKVKDDEYIPDEDEESDEEDENGHKVKRRRTTTATHVKVPANRPNFYGAVEGVDVGTVWLTRMECCRDGVHRPTVAGIHGGENGTYSIALSGGYEDDIDLGECFTYTGEGGRDLKGTVNKPKNLRTAPQSRDQTLTRGNLALSRNVDTGNPVRVIRGYKLRSQFAPDEGYRYDGLYTVEKCWFTTGMSGYGVWKFALQRCKDQAPPPWDITQDEKEIGQESPKKVKKSKKDVADILDTKTTKESTGKLVRSDSKDSTLSKADSGIESDCCSVAGNQA